MDIQYLKNSEIDRDQWNECIDKSINGLIYAHDWYLDIVSPGWEALILGEYDAVFPLPFLKKYGIPYLSHPFFAQQLGVFYKKENKAVVDRFIKALPIKYKEGELVWDLNEYEVKKME